MSSLTICNRCQLNTIRRKAKSNGLKVTRIYNDVYVHPMDILIRELPGGKEGDRKPFWVAWFMGVSKECCC